MADDGLQADDLRTIELDDALSGAASLRPFALFAHLSARESWRLALGLMIGGAALAWLAEAGPWATASVAYFYSTTSAFTLTAPDPLLTLLARLAQAQDGPTQTQSTTLVFAGVKVYMALGALFAVALASAMRPRARMALLLAYGVWLATLVARLVVSTALLAAGDGAVLAPTVSSSLRLISAAPAWGLWLMWLAALLGAVGAVSVRRRLAQDAGVSASAIDETGAPGSWLRSWLRELAARPRAERWGAGLTTLGVAIWACGFFTLPWLTQGCAGVHFALTHFVSGSCAGLGAANTLSESLLAPLFVTGSASGPSDLAPISGLVSSTESQLLSVSFVYLSLATLVGWALLRLWSGVGGARRYGWTLAWLALACVVAALAFQGSRVTLANPPILDISITDAWVYGPGLAVTLVGLAVAGGGVACALASGVWQGVVRSGVVVEAQADGQ